MNILDWLQVQYPESSMRTLRNLLKSGRVQKDGKRIIVASTPINPDDPIEILKKQLPVEEGLNILYEDRDLVVIDKKEGLLSVATDFDKEKTAHAILKKRKKSACVYPVHRLDRETSGVMVFAYTEKAREFLKNLFYLHDITREYAGIVEGVLPSDSGTWSSYLAEDDFYVVKSVNSEQEGRLAVTHYEVVKRMPKTTLVRFKLETGRKNQIRVHAQEAGHSLLGDKKYGAKLESFGRLALHAYFLRFVHPTTKKVLSFSSVPSFAKNLSFWRNR